MNKKRELFEELELELYDENAPAESNREIKKIKKIINKYI